MTNVLQENFIFISFQIPIIFIFILVEFLFFIKMNVLEREKLYFRIYIVRYRITYILNICHIKITVINEFSRIYKTLKNSNSMQFYILKMFVFTNTVPIFLPSKD